jgi:hypothetical protein
LQQNKKVAFFFCPLNDSGVMIAVFLNDNSGVIVAVSGVMIDVS